MNARQPMVIERTYRARVEELWDLWTTKEGFESWWGPQDFRVEVHAIDPRVGGEIRYDMIAATPAMVEAMKQMGQPDRHATHGRFTEVVRHARLAITHVIDFLPGVKPHRCPVKGHAAAAVRGARSVGARRSARCRTTWCVAMRRVCARAVG